MDLTDKDLVIFRDELFLASNMKVNGQFLYASMHNNMTYPLFGTSMDALLPEDRIAIERLRSRNDQNWK